MTKQELVATNDVRLYCQQVTTGAKPVASIQLHYSCLKPVLNVCIEYGLRYYCSIEGCEDTEFFMLFIYKHKFLETIIEHSLKMKDANPVQIFFRGCMYGYGMAEIAEYVKNNTAPPAV